MRKLIFEFLLIVILFDCLVSCSLPGKKEQSKEITSEQRNELPSMIIHVLDGTNLAVNTLLGKKHILVLFQPDCDHCQNEVSQIKQNISEFKSYEVYFISAAKPEEVKKFSVDFELNNERNFHFATVDVQSILDSYGPIQAPSMYIYSNRGKLLSQFNGETKIDSVLKYL